MSISIGIQERNRETLMKNIQNVKYAELNINYKLVKAEMTEGTYKTI